MLQSYADAVICRDIIERHTVASAQSLKYVLQYLLHNFARKTSVRAIAGVLKQLSLPSDRESLAEYLSYYADSYFAYPVSLRTDSLAVRRTNPDKYYLVDLGMIGALKASCKYHSRCQTAARARELSALRDARRETGIDDCTVVTWDEEGEEDGVHLVPAWKWMLYGVGD